MPRKKLSAEAENPMPVETGDGFAPDGDLFGQESGYAPLLTERNGADGGDGIVLTEDSPASSPEESQPPGGDGLFFGADSLPPETENPALGGDSLPSGGVPSDGVPLDWESSIGSGDGGAVDAASPGILSAVLEEAGIQLPEGDASGDAGDREIPYGEEAPQEEGIRQTPPESTPPEEPDHAGFPAGDGDMAAVSPMLTTQSAPPAPSVPPAAPVRRTAARSRTASRSGAADESGAGSGAVPSDTTADNPPSSASGRTRTSRVSSEAAADRAAFFGLKFNDLDRNLTPEQRQEWNTIYASYRGRSVMSGSIVGIDRVLVRAVNPKTDRPEYRQLYCAVVIPYRVRIVIPETEMWFPGEERPHFVLRNMYGANIDFVIIRVDRENGLAVGSRKMALPTRRYYFSTQPGMNRPGSRIQFSMLAIGPRRCLVTCHGYDVDLSQRDLSWTPIPDLRDVYHPGDVLDCIVKEYDSRENRLALSVKELGPNPYDGAEFRNPVGCSRQAVITGKYGGGVFCSLLDDLTVMCNYAFHYDDSVFSVGDRVILMIERYEDDKKQVYGKIVAKA